MQGLNLDGNPRKKKALIDFLLSIPKIADEAMKKSYTKHGFVASGMIGGDDELFATFNGLMSTCRRWVSCNKDVGLPKSQKINCKNQFQALMKIQLEKSQVVSSDMTPLGIPRGK